ncbi:MAG TPA: FAD-dependent oxidoreductase [Gemmatimonadaceae bacterium]
MSKPVILTVDDEPDVLNAIERDLRAHFRTDYRIVKVGSGTEALDVVRELKQRGANIALFMVDERMPGMTGTQFLMEAITLYPAARKVLLTAYADTETAITAINKIGLDQYLTKPWDPPTERLYPVLDDLLADWVTKVRPAFEGVRVAGSVLSAESFAVKDFLSSNLFPYQWIDLERDAAMRELASAHSPDLMRLPVVFLPDGSVLVQPDVRTLAARIGMQLKPSMPFYDLVVVGGGPAGLAGAVYGASEGLRTILVESRAPGGQAGTSSQIENYLGFPSGISGSELARRAVAQARRFGAEIVAPQEVTGIRRDDPYRVVTLADGSELSSYAVLLAPGMEVRRLDVPDLDRLVGAGVFYGAAMTEAAAVRGQDVMIIGGANSAGQGAMFFSRYARKVTMVLRGATLGAAMSQYLVDRILATPNIEVMLNTRVTGVAGASRLGSVTLTSTATGEASEQPTCGLFIFIGTAPRTRFVSELLQLDQQGFILTGPDLMGDGKRPRGWMPERDPFLFETSVPGVFAAGDARSGAGKRVASAVGEGSATVRLVHSYLSTV